MIGTTLMSPFGATVTGLDLAAVGGAEVEQLRSLLADLGVIVMPGQFIDDEIFVRFLRRFGDLVFTAGETPVADFPALNVVSNVGRSTAPTSVFHVDTSYVRNPPMYTALRAIEVPAEGGETLFSDQYAAFEALPPDVRRTLSGRTIRHVVTGLELGDDAETAAEHPVFRRHPLSGRTALYLSAPARCAAVSGLGAQEAAETVAFLYEHSTRAGNTLRHSWSPGDVIMWDNGCVLHRADHSAVSGDRVMHRGMVAGATVTGPQRAG